MPAAFAVSNTVRSVAPVSSVTVIALLICTASLIVAVTLIDEPTLYEPSAVDEVNEATVGAVVSIVTAKVLDVCSTVALST